MLNFTLSLSRLRRLSLQSAQNGERVRRVRGARIFREKIQKSCVPLADSLRSVVEQTRCRVVVTRSPSTATRRRARIVRLSRVGRGPRFIWCTYILYVRVYRERYCSVFRV